MVLRFDVNSLQFPEFRTDDKSALRFVDCSRFRLGETNDEGFYLGQCRFTGLAPEWGEFYAVVDEPRSVDGPNDWVILKATSALRRTHFLFDFRDCTFECVARDCVIEPTEKNVLLMTNNSVCRFGCAWTVPQSPNRDTAPMVAHPSPTRFAPRLGH